jgi:hypothetical protein
MFGLDASEAEVDPHDHVQRPLNVLSHPVYTYEENRSVQVNWNIISLALPWNVR